MTKLREREERDDTSQKKKVTWLFPAQLFGVSQCITDHYNSLHDRKKSEIFKRFSIYKYIESCKEKIFSDILFDFSLIIKRHTINENGTF